MYELTEEKRARIVAAAERCEKQMTLESTYLRVGDFESAALCAEFAEIDSVIAFRSFQ